MFVISPGKEGRKNKKKTYHLIYLKLLTSHLLQNGEKKKFLAEKNSNTFFDQICLLLWWERETGGGWLQYQVVDRGVVVERVNPPTEFQ